jgi:hypothetical protein
MTTPEAKVPNSKPKPAASAAASGAAVKVAKRAKRRKIWQVLVPMLAVAALLGGGVFFLLNQGSPPIPRGNTASVLASERLDAPLPLDVRLLGPGQGKAGLAGECRRTLQEMSKIADVLASDLEAAGTASADAVVMPEQRKAGQAVQLAAHQRWEFRVPQNTSMEAYCHILDFFGIELGVIGGSKDITYISKFKQPKPEKRVASGRKDRRLYLTWAHGTEVDKELVIRAGVELGDRVIAEFIPPDLEKKMLETEREYAAKHGNRMVEKTIFSIRPDGDGYAFYVVDQQSDN